MRISLCNEVIAELPFERQCALAAALGYDGLEIAPMTLAEDPTRLSGTQIAELRSLLEFFPRKKIPTTFVFWLLD